MSKWQGLLHQPHATAALLSREHSSRTLKEKIPCDNCSCGIQEHHSHCRALLHHGGSGRNPPRCAQKAAIHIIFQIRFEYLKKLYFFNLAPVFHIISAVETSKNTRWNSADCHALENNLLNNTTLPQILHHRWTRAPSPTLAKLETLTRIILLHPGYQFLPRWTNSVDCGSLTSFQHNQPISISKIPVLPSFWITSTSAPDL